jgi:LysR family transcriptional regulator, glycine cleavage system transcriptional activator
MKVTSRLPLNALRVFEAVAQTNSMARASEALSVQPSAVSMQMKNLSEYVGVALVRSRGRKLELTAAGLELLPAVRSGLAEIEAKIRTLQSAAATRPFTLSVLPSFLHCWLLPRLPNFEELHPDFKLQILTSRELVDVTNGAVDAAVRLGTGKWPSIASVKLMNEKLIPVAAPKVASHHKLQIDDSFALLTAAEDGRGVALVRESLCDRAFKTGRLVKLGEPIDYRYSSFFVQALHSSTQQRGDVLLQWLKAQIALTACIT